MRVVKYKHMRCSRCGAEWLAYEDLAPTATCCPICNNMHGLQWYQYDGDHEVGDNYAGEPDGYDWDWLNYERGDSA